MLLTYLLISILSTICVQNCFQTHVYACGESNSTTSPSYYASSQWAIDKIELDKAWDITTGSSSVSVGVIDSGIRATHDDLSSNVVTGSTALHTYISNNGYSTSLEDLCGHGTHVAGIIGADGSNTYGIAGVCWDVNLVSLRGGHISGSSNYMYYYEMAQLVNYAGQNNISIVNLSYGGYDSDTNNILSSLASYNGLIICSAGNYGNDNDSNTFLPASLHYDNMIVVGNSTSSDSIYYESNYGHNTVDLFAPGTDIISTMNNSDYNYASWTGTSMAAPYVTGVAALLKSINPNLTPAQIKFAILNNVDPISSMANKCVSGGRLNAYKAALSVLPTFTPSQTISSVCPIEIGGYQWCKISVNQPMSKLFYNASSMSLSAYLYSDIQSSTPLASGFSNGTGQLFNYSFPCMGTYYLKIMNNSSYSGNYSIDMNNTHYHNYGEPYIWQNNTYHLATCSCGNTILQPHATQSGTGDCILCGGSASGGFIGPNGICQPILTDSYLYPNGIISLGNIDFNAYMNGLLTVEDIYGWNTI